MATGKKKSQKLYHPAGDVEPIDVDAFLAKARRNLDDYLLQIKRLLDLNKFEGGKILENHAALNLHDGYNRVLREYEYLGDLRRELDR